jgi:hypothetical protein
LEDKRLPRENAPISLDAAVTKVHAKAKEFIQKSDTAGKPADGYRTYVEPDKKVYVTTDKADALAAKWRTHSCGSDRFTSQASGSSTGAQVDLKLQLKADWGTWTKNTSPFVYHIPIDTYYSPAMKKKEEEAKAQKAAKRRFDKMTAEWNAALKAKTVKASEKSAWDKKWMEANKNKTF